MHLMIPFASTDAPGCGEALKALALPHLDALMGLLPAAGIQTGDDFSLSTPLDRCLAEALGLPALADGHFPWAAREALQRGLAAPGAAASAAWALITPCHWRIATDHIAMGDPAALALTEEESRALLALMQPFFDDDHITLHYAAPTRWLAQGEAFRDITAASLDRVTGRTVDIWMARGPESRHLRRLQSEMQMLLYTAAPNEAREARKQTPVNSFWVSDCGAWPTGAPLDVPGLQLREELRPFALRDDWAVWAGAWQALDAGPVAVALQAVRRGDRDVTLTLCGERGAAVFSNAGSGGWTRFKSKITSLLGRQRLLDLRKQL